MIFSGSSGIRMVWGKDLINLGYQLGLALGNKFEDILIASDFRETSDALVSLMAGAIMAGGSMVYYGGKVPTPTLAYSAKYHEAGVMITASHNPPEYNGIKLWNPDGSAFTEEQMEELNKETEIEDWNRVGKYKQENILELHKDALLSEFKGIDLNIVIDCSNGAGSVITPFLLRELGGKVVTLNCHPSGLFPGHPSEPSEKNLEILKKFVLSKKANLGIAHDGDADRFIAITSSGKYLTGDHILAVFTKVLGFKKIVAPVDSSMILDEFAEVIRCPVGDANVSATMKKLNVEFGGENSGTQIFASWRYTPDAIYAALKFAEIVQKEDIDSIVDDFPKYYTLRENLYYSDRKNMEKKIENFVADYDVNRIDGYRVNLDDGWFLIRFSGTEPKLRITVEFKDKKRGEIMMNKILNSLKN